uniref:RRM domain-containing protein n=1 Tax=Anopheles christyi TaxID=43041 RepID=A0A182K593_9DIPT
MASANDLSLIPVQYAQDKKYCLYVANISPRVDLPMLVELLNRYGQFNELLFSRSYPGREMKCAIVWYNDPDSLLRTVHHMNGAWLFDNLMYAAASIDTITVPILSSNELHVANISEWINAEVLLNLFLPAGCVTQLMLQRNVYGYREAFVTFRSSLDAELARQLSNGIDLGDGYVLRVSHRCAQTNGGPVSPAEFRRLQNNRFLGCFIRVSRFRPTMSEPLLRDMFKRYGKLDQVSLLYGFNKQPLGFALLRYNTDEAAQWATTSMHNTLIDGRQLKVERVGNPLLPYTDAV